MMPILDSFLAGWNAGPFYLLAQLLSLGPDMLIEAIVLLAALFFLNDLLRTALLPQATRSILAHLTCCALTLLPGIVLGFVLVWAAHEHPDRAWLNLGIAAFLYLFWILGGAITRAVRSDSEGADIGWIFHGAVITFALGVGAALIFAS
jgi:hypothetical protein